MPPVPTRARARVVTRTGDRGETALFGATRVRKTDPRIAALGDLDEAQAALGIARAFLDGTAGRTLLELQRGLYTAMAEIAVPQTERERLPQRIDQRAVDVIEALAEELQQGTAAEPRFVVPGENLLSAALDLARTVVRRAERSVVQVIDAGLVSSEHLLPWLNRLSDVLFMLARAAEPAATPAKSRSRAGQRSRGAARPRGR
jgi:cob(I)alamin adenosyltransferase